jgi:hypothetical protein
MLFFKGLALLVPATCIKKKRRKKKQKKKGGQDSLVDKRWTKGRKVLGSILALTTKGVQHERLIVSPCEILKIC